MIPKSEIAAAILHAKDWELANQYYAGDYDRFVRECGITKEDLLSYVWQYGFPSGWIHLEPSLADGLYIVNKDDKWVMYLQERGVIEEKSMESFFTYKETVEAVIEYYFLPKKISD